MSKYYFCKNIKSKSNGLQSCSAVAKLWFRRGKNPAPSGYLLMGLVFFSAGCTTLFGWDIHAPGLLSQYGVQNISPAKERLALYLSPEVLSYESKNKGGKMADPQTYHVGEAYGPMLVEAFQQGFEEFILMETEPTPAILKQYGIPHVAVVRIKDFGNRVTLKGQAVSLVTETILLDQDLNPLARFESTGTSDAKKVFAKKGGPEVNLNAAIEHNVLAIVQVLQDVFSHA